MIEIDGNHGEGGGQILRSALSLSCLLGHPIRLFDIRNRRNPPGLRPQHLMAVNAARQIGRADVKGAVLGSQELLFTPNGVAGGAYRLDIGTAGSTSLVLQTVIPPLLFARESSTVELIGGTHVRFSPSYHYIHHVFFPVLRTLGCDLRITMDVAGFYPRGGGIVRAEIHPVRELGYLDSQGRGKFERITGSSVVANLPDHIAIRQMEAAREKMESLGCGVEIETGRLPSRGRGSSIFLIPAVSPPLTGFEGLGAPGKPAERVGAEAAEKLLKWFNSGMALDQYLPDQLVIYLALGKKKSRFTTMAITRHLLTNLWVTSRFLDYSYSVEGDAGGPGRVVIN